MPSVVATLIITFCLLTLAACSGVGSSRPPQGPVWVNGPLTSPQSNGDFGGDMR